MNSEFDVLTNVYFRHTYFEGARFNRFVIQPLKSTQREMINQGWLFKSSPDGFKILYDKSVSPVAGKIRLTFIINLNDPDFFNYTALNIANMAKEILVFKASEDKANVDHTLHAGAFASEEDVCSVDDQEYRFFTKPFGIIELDIHEKTQKIYHINFQSKATYWRYILCSDHLKSLEYPAIIDSSGKDIFEGPGELTLPDWKTAVAFVSKEPVLLSQYALRSFQLVENYQEGSVKYKVIIKTLPAPDVSKISRISEGAGSVSINYSEIFLY